MHHEAELYISLRHSVRQRLIPILVLNPALYNECE